MSTPLSTQLPADPASRARIVKAVNALRKLDRPTQRRLLQRLADKHGFELPPSWAEPANVGPSVRQ